MDRSKQQIAVYVQALKCHIENLEAYLQDGKAPEELNSASKAVVLSTALLDEMIERFVKLDGTRSAAVSAGTGSPSRRKSGPDFNNRSNRSEAMTS